MNCAPTCLGCTRSSGTDPSASRCARWSFATLSSTVTEALESGEPSLVVVGQAADADVLAALTVAELRLRRTDAPVVAVTNGPRTLVTLVREHPRIEVFDVHAELCADDAIARGQLEAMARALHDGYLRQVEATLGTEERAAKPAYRTWDVLSADLRGKNYSAARGIWGFLKECGYDVLPRSAGHDEVRAFPAATLHRLAGLEFTRWYRETHPGWTRSRVVERGGAGSRLHH